MLGFNIFWCYDCVLGDDSLGQQVEALLNPACPICTEGRSKDHSVKDSNLMLSSLHNKAIYYHVENPRFVPHPNCNPDVKITWNGYALEKT